MYIHASFNLIGNSNDDILPFDVDFQHFTWSKERIDDSRKQSDKARDMCLLAEKLGCNPTQLSIAWTLKHETVQCLLIGATTVEQLLQSLQALQVI